MNEDFALSLTPANARRLLHLQKITGFELAPEILALAEHDRIKEEDFDLIVCPYNEVNATITQFLLDCGMRGVVQQNYHPTFNETALLNAVRLSKPEHIVVFSETRKDIWMTAARSLFIDNLRVEHSLSTEDLDRYRSGVLIVDRDRLVHSTIAVKIGSLRFFAHEFEKIVIFDGIRDFALLEPWSFLGKILFPAMPTPYYTRVVADVPSSYRHPISMFALFFNVCIFPDLITDWNISNFLGDETLRDHFSRDLLT